ncbi:cellulose binding domain-containing protein [Micromonospora craniellae]|nr:cellulose binding domain-containing protein [Micromonospora craniellae]
MSIGLLAMVVLLVIAIGAYRGPGPEFGPAPPGPAAAPPIPERASSAGREAASPPAPAVPGLSPRKTDPPSGAGTASPKPSSSPASEAPPVASAPPRSSAPPSAKPAPFEARYQVMNTFQGGFIAEVLIRNTARSDQGWVARVEYSGGRVVTAWLEGVPQGTFSGRRGTLTYRSGPDLAAGATVALRFHIEFADPSPVSCAVSGRACSRR